MAKLLVKNLPNHWAQGEVIKIIPDGAEFGVYESKTKFDAAFPNQEWPRHFVIVNVPGEVSDFEYLLEDNEAGRRYHIKAQGSESPLYPLLIEYAEVTVPIAVLNSQIIDKGL